MYYVYIIKSSFKNWFYIGLTNNIDKRLNNHSLGYVKSTKYYKPFNLVYVEIFMNRLDARNFEKYLKIRFNKEAVIKLINI